MRLPLAIGIPCYSNAAGLGRLALQLYAQEGISADLYLIGTGPAAEAECKLWERRGASLWLPGDNIGVPAAWNALAASAFLNGRQEILLCNDDIEMADDWACYRFLLAHKLHSGKALLTAGKAGYHCFLLPRQLFLDIGPFDAGFYPGYYEDLDYGRRIALHGGYTELALGVAISHLGAGSSAADPALKALLKKAAPYAAARYAAKWGGPPGAEKFAMPWGGGTPLPGIRELLAKPEAGDAGK